MAKTFPFFIVGSDRSGTTMLRLMLNEHPDLHVPRETWFIIDLMNALPLNSPLDNEQKNVAYNIITQHERWADLEIENVQLKNIIDALKTPSLQEIMDKIYLILTEREDKKRWGDKTPEYIKDIKRLHVVFPDAKFIHVIRDGRDVCISLLKKRWRGSMVPSIARYWSEYVDAGARSGRKLPKEIYMEVTYESIVSDTEGKLKSICNFLEIEFNPCMLTFYKNAEKNIAPWEKGHHQKTMRAPKTEDLYRWKREASLTQILAFEAIAGETMDLVGQERRYRGVTRILPSIFGLLEGLFFNALYIRREVKKFLKKYYKTTNNH